MLTSTNLSMIPFLGHCDNARLQMSAKQLAQSLTHLNCEIPKVVGHDYHYLSNTSRRFKCTAVTSGEIIFTDEEIMIVNYYSGNNRLLQVYEVPPILNTSSLFATQLRYKRQVGEFQQGDILYEYDCFHNNIPTYGYNVWTAYMSFFGLNHEDSTVLSQSLLNRMRSIKIEPILIPITSNSIFYQEYPDSPYRFLPMVGEKIHGNILTRRPAIKITNNPSGQFKNSNLSDLTSISLSLNLQNTIPITSRIPDAMVVDLKVHSINSDIKLIDRDLEVWLTRIRQETSRTLKETVQQLWQMFPKKYANDLLRSYYIMANTTKNSLIDRNQVKYLVEVVLAADMPSHLGDKSAK